MRVLGRWSHEARGRSRADVVARHLPASDEGFERAFQDAAIGMTLSSPHPRDDGVILRANRAAGEIFGCAPEALVGVRPRELFHPHEQPMPRDYWARLLKGRGGAGATVRRLRGLDGRAVWAKTHASVVRDPAGQALFVISQIEDITAERQAREAAERRLAQQTAVAQLGQRALLEDAPERLFEAAVTTAASACGAPFAGLVVRETDGSLRVVAGVGWPVGQLLAPAPRGSQTAYTLERGGPVIVDDVGTEQRFDVDALVERGVASGMSVVVAGEGGEPFGVLGLHASQRSAFTTDDIAFLTSVANILAAVVQRDAAARDLLHQSLHDPLTGLPNRSLLLDRLRRAMARARRDGTTMAVLFCDMDDFKYVNDTLGHDAGDRLLAALAPRLSAALRATDTLARFGGDEFVVLCEGMADGSEVVPIADRLLDACSTPVDLGGSEFVPTASIGVAVAPGGGDSDPEALLRDADVALYGAKARGKGRYELFDVQMRTRTVERVGLLADLRHAITREELIVEFQPIVSLRRREVAGLEALVRWRHPERGVLVPDQFIGLAEDAGLIHELGRWVIDEAVRHTVSWRRRRTPVLERVMTAVNVSWRQISHATLVEDVQASLRRHALPPGAFCVEVTESALMEDPERARVALAELAELGVHLSLDDFGTGQSSLAVLRGFPFDTIKLDRSFMAGGDWAVVRAVTQMARSLDLLVVAEGIEVAEQDHRAGQLGCDFGQGWLYAAPLGADELEEQITRVNAALAARH